MITVSIETVTTKTQDLNSLKIKMRNIEQIQQKNWRWL